MCSQIKNMELRFKSCRYQFVHYDVFSIEFYGTNLLGKKYVIVIELNECLIFSGSKTCV